MLSPRLLPYVACRAELAILSWVLGFVLACESGTSQDPASGGVSGDSGTATGGAGSFDGAIPVTANVVFTQINESATTCLPRPLAVETNTASPNYDQIPCSVVEATTTSGACSCDPNTGRQLPSALLEVGASNMLTTLGHCGGDTGVSCQSFCFCEVVQLTGSGLAACQNDTRVDPQLNGFCYIDIQAAPPVGSSALVAQCPTNMQRALRFVGQALSAAGTFTLLACTT
jgi:hypothetical protein